MPLLSNMEEIKEENRIFQKFSLNAPLNIFFTQIGLIGIYNMLW